MDHAVRILEVSRALMVWEEADEPWLHLTSRVDREVTRAQEPPGKYEPAVSPSLRTKSFFFSPRPQESSFTVETVEGESDIADPIHPGLRERFNLESAACVPLYGSSISGHLIVPDLDPSFEGLLAAQIVARLIAIRFDQFRAIDTAREDAVTEERLRVARDLHDGLLQSFTGVVLQLETVHQILKDEPEVARKRITELQGVIMSDQRELRSYLQHLRPRSLRSEGHFDLVGPLTELRERYERQWSIDVDFKVETANIHVSQSLGEEVNRLIAEAVANAAKHGQAQNVFLEISAEPHELLITVHDDGTGFSFEGLHNLEQLRKLRIGPVSLSERITSLGGDLTIDSQASGVRLEMRIPLTWPGVE